jgi:predicted HNH restriction endonuclease
MYLLQAVAKRRLKVRQMAIDYKGGKCEICGYNKCVQALDFHHLDKSQKSFGISAKGYTRSWKTVQAELDKCILLCANCHREVHIGITQLPVETLE